MKNNDLLIKLNDVVVTLEANKLFDKENFTTENERMLNVVNAFIKSDNLKTEELKNPIVACVTGHRPQKLPERYDYNYDSVAYQELKTVLKQVIIENNITDAWTGMAHGVDLAFAAAVLELRDSKYPIKLHCAIPCKDHKSKMFGDALKLYEYILEKADEKLLVSDENYAPYLMQKRNEYMVDHSTKVLAVCNMNEITSERSGTRNCIEYAVKNNKDIIYIDPDTFDIK